MRRLAAVVALAAVLVAVGAACPAPRTAPASLRATSGETTVDVALAPFSLAFGAAKTTSSGEACAPLSLALRAPSDTGAWHKPEKPSGDELWLHPGKAAAVDGAHVKVDMVDESGAVKAHATVALADAGDGWVDITATFDVDEVDVAYVGTCLALASDEHLVGGGERFDGPDLRGHVVPLYFDAPGDYDSGTNEAHAPVPFFASSKGYAVLVDEERVGAFDVGVADAGATAVRFHGSALKLAVRTGGIVDDVAALARRMGLPPEPPAWALAPMQWRNSLDVTTDANGAVTESGTDKLLADAAEMRALHIPASTIWIDAPWETGYNTFTVNDPQLPGFADALATLEGEGFHVVTWATDALNSSDDSGQAYGMPPSASLSLFNDFADRGLLVSTKDGTPFVFPWGRGTGGFVDFTNGDACDAYQELMRPLLAGGVRGFKLDYGETMRPDVLGLLPNDVPRFFDGTSAATEQTRFSRLYHECYLGALDDVWPSDWFVITRTGGIYDQKNGTAIWPGDLDATFAKHGDDDGGKLAVGGLPAAVGGYLSLAMSAYPLYGSDVGGYRKSAASPELFLRWAQFGAGSTVMQTGGGANQAAWDDAYRDGLDAYVAAARFHMDLLPMWQEWLKRAHLRGTPVAVPVGVVDGSEDAWRDAFTFVLGGDKAGPLLVAPVVEEGATTRTLFVPAGTWTSFFHDDVVVHGPGLVTVDAPLDELPVFVKDDAVLVLSDPRLDTVLDCASCTAATGDVRERRVVRARVPDEAGSAEAAVGEVVGVLQYDVDGAEGHASFTALGDDGGALVLDLRLGAHTLVAGSATLAGRTADAVADEEALLSCAPDDACLLVEDHRVMAAASGRSLELDVDVE